MTAARVDRDVVSQKQTVLFTCWMFVADLRAAGGAAAFKSEVSEVHMTIDKRFKLIEECSLI